MRMTTPVAKLPVPSIPPSWPLDKHLSKMISVVIEMDAPAIADALETDVDRRIEEDGNGGHSHSLREINLADKL
jgi:hypothetical protein